MALAWLMCIMALYTTIFGEAAQRDVSERDCPDTRRPYAPVDRRRRPIQRPTTTSAQTVQLGCASRSAVVKAFVLCRAGVNVPRIVYHGDLLFVHVRLGCIVHEYKLGCDGMDMQRGGILALATMKSRLHVVPCPSNLYHHIGPRYQDISLKMMTLPEHKALYF